MFKKRSMLVIIVLMAVLMLISSVTLAWPGDGTGSGVHSHTWGSWVDNGTYYQSNCSGCDATKTRDKAGTGDLAGDIDMTVTDYNGVYDGTAHGIQVSVSSPTGTTIRYGTSSGSITATALPTYTNAGTYTIFYKVTKAGYVTVTGSAQVIIAKKEVTITAKDQAITYGESITSGTAQITSSGLLSGHSISSITLTPSSANAGTASIIPSSAEVKNSSNTSVTSNYKIRYDNGNLTINKATPIISLSSDSSHVSYSRTRAFSVTISSGMESTTISGKMNVYVSEKESQFLEIVKNKTANISATYAGDVKEINYLGKKATTSANTYLDIKVEFTPNDLNNYEVVSIVHKARVIREQPELSITPESAVGTYRESGSFTVNVNAGTSQTYGQTGYFCEGVLSAISSDPSVVVITNGGGQTLTSNANGTDVIFNYTYIKASTSPVTITVSYKANDKSNFYDADDKTFTITKVNKSSTFTTSVEMSDYQYGGTLPTPKLSYNPENATVKFYYNTSNSTSGGTEWKNMTSTKLNAGTYYMYAIISASTNFNSYTTPAVSFKVNKGYAKSPSIEDSVRPYDMGEHNIRVMGTPTGGQLYYSTDGTNWSTQHIYRRDVGTTTVYYYTKGSANYYDSEVSSAKIVISPGIHDFEISVSPATSTYDSTPKKPTVTVQSGSGTLTEGVDYTCTYQNNVHASTEAKVIINGINNYVENNAQQNFTIVATDLTCTAPTINIKYGEDIPSFDYTYTGLKGDDTPVLKGTYSTTYTKGYGVGTYPITKGTLALDNTNYFKASDYTMTFVNGSIVVAPQSIDNWVVTVSSVEYTYDGTAHKPTVTVKDSVTGTTLKEGEDKDYTIAYSNNTNAGTARVTITGVNNYAGTITKDFTINKRELIVVPNSLSKTYKASDPTLTYNVSNAIETPAFTGALSRVTGEDVGTYAVLENTLTMKDSGSFKASNYYQTFDNSKVFSITKGVIDSSTNVTLSSTSYDYDGTPKTPTVTVKIGTTTLVNNADYKIAYNNNINPGTATVTITGIGNYSGSKTVNFTINGATITGNVTIISETANPIVGNTLSANVNVLPSDATLSYAWYKNQSKSTNNGTIIAKAVDSHIYLTDAEVGYYIYVVVTATKDNYTTKELRAVYDNVVGENKAPTAPVITAKLTDSSGAEYVSGTWTNKNIFISLKSEDDFGIARYSYSTISETEGFNNTINADSNGEGILILSNSGNKTKYYFRAVDKNGNVGKTSSIVVAIDKVAPAIGDITFDIKEWTNGSVVATANANDTISGIGAYSFDATGSNTYTIINPLNEISVSETYENNITNCYFRVKDMAGNVASKAFSISNIDKTAPSMSVTEVRTTEEIKLEITTSDTLSLIKDVTANGEKLNLKKAGSSTWTAEYKIVDAGDYEIVATDNAGNQNSYTKKNVYAVRYSGNGVSGTMKNRLFMPDESEVIKPCEYQADGFTFVSWNTKSDGTGITYNPGTSYMTNATLNLFAIWEKATYELDRVVLNNYEYDYLGSPITPKEMVYNKFGKLLQEDEDYLVRYENNTDVGLAKVIITGLNSYKDQTVETEFAIKGMNISNANISLEPTLYTYDGYAKTPNVTVKIGNDTLVRGKDYTITYENNINVGTATCRVVGRGSKYGTVETTYAIIKGTRTLKVYDLALVMGESQSLEYSYTGSKVEDTLVSSNASVASVTSNDVNFIVTANEPGNTTLTYTVPEDSNYTSATATVQVIVYESSESSRPAYGGVLINDGAKYAVSPRVLLSLEAQCAKYMYISTDDTPPTKDSANWIDYSTKMPFEFSNTAGEKRVYVWFKDGNDNISAVETDEIILDSSYEYPANDTVLLDKSEVDVTQPEIDIKSMNTSGVTLDIILKQQDKLVNGTRSGVDKSTVRYGYKSKDDSTGEYTWSTNKTVSGLAFGTKYVAVTESYDKAGNGPTVSNEYEFITPSKYDTIITLKDAVAQYDGLIHEIGTATFEKYGNNELTGEIEYTYYTDRECNHRTSVSANGTISEGGAPSKPGTYYVKATLTNDANYHDTTSNIGKLHIGWYISDDSSNNLFSYVEETATGSDQYVLTVYGKGVMVSMDELSTRGADKSLSYWYDFKDKIVRLDLGNEESKISTIGANMFSDLTALQSVKIPNTVTAIGDYAFAGDTSLNSKVIIPESVNRIGINPFASTKVTEFEVSFGNDYYTTIDGVLFTENKKELVSYPCGNNQVEYSIPVGTEKILTSAFEGSNILQIAVIPDGIRDISAKAFYDCSQLAQIEIYELADDTTVELRTVGIDAFKNIKDNSAIYTFDEKIAKMVVQDRNYKSTSTTVYWPPKIKTNPIDMFGTVGYTVKFVAEAEPGYPDNISYQWYKVADEKPYPEAIGGTGANTNQYTTATLTLENDGDRYVCVAYNMEYYKTKQYTMSKPAKITMLDNIHYMVERGTYNSYLFATLQEAFNFVEEDDVIKVISNAPLEGDAILSGHKSVTLNNNGFNINFNGTLSVEEDSQLTLNGAGTISKSGGFISEVAGTIKIANGSFAMRNETGSGIRLVSGATLEFESGLINVKDKAISATSATVNLTSPYANILATSDTDVNAVELFEYTKFNMAEGTILANSVSDLASKVVGIYNAAKDDVNMNKGKVTITGGNVKATGNGVITGDAIVNADSADVEITGGIIEGTRSAIENITRSRYSDIIVRSGIVRGNYYGIINNSNSAKVTLGTKDGDVSMDSPSIHGNKVAIFDASLNDTLQFYDGSITSDMTDGNSIIVYETYNNTSLVIDDSITEQIFTDSTRAEIETEDGYSIYSRIEGGLNKATLRENALPDLSIVPNQTVEIGKMASFAFDVSLPGHPDVYIFEWQVSTDYISSTKAGNWNRVTSGIGFDTQRYTTAPVTMQMDGNWYRCKVTSRSGTKYTEPAKLTVTDESLYKDKNPSVRVMYLDNIKYVTTDSEGDKCVKMQIIVKAFSELKHIYFNYETEKDLDLENVNELSKSDTNGLAYIKQYNVIQNQDANEPDVTEYTYTFDLYVYKNGSVTVTAIDAYERKAVDTQTIDAFSDIRVGYTVSELSDVNPRLVVTFFANKPVAPKSSSAGNAHLDLKSVDGNVYSYKFTYMPTNPVPETIFVFEDEFSNEVEIKVPAITRIEYKDIKFSNDDSTSIDDLTPVDAYYIAQKLEEETETNANFDVQSRYGLSGVQADMFMARARDVGAADTLLNATSAKSYDGYYLKEFEQSIPENSEYNYKPSNNKIYVSAIAVEDDELSKEKSSYVDTIQNSEEYKGADVSGFSKIVDRPYMNMDSSGRAYNIANEVSNSSFRAVIVTN